MKHQTANTTETPSDNISAPETSTNGIKIVENVSTPLSPTASTTSMIVDKSESPETTNDV